MSRSLRIETPRSLRLGVGPTGHSLASSALWGQSVELRPDTYLFRSCGAKLTIMVASEHQKSLPELSDSLVRNRLRGNDRVTPAAPGRCLEPLCGASC